MKNTGEEVSGHQHFASTGKSTSRTSRYKFPTIDTGYTPLIGLQVDKLILYYTIIELYIIQ